MPLAIGTVTAPTVVTPAGSVLDSEVLAVTWTAPDGTVVPLTTPGLGWWTLNAAVAFGAVPVTVTADPNPRYGARVRHVQPQPRLITWPLHVEGASHTEFVGRWRNLARLFTQTRRLGPGTLTVLQPDGSARQIAAYYQGGFDGEPGAGWWYDTAVLTLYCEDPYWSDVSSTTVARAYSAGGTNFLSTFPTMSSSRTLGATTINNPGDAEAWPAWTIVGPAAGLTATNNTTGESFVLTPIGGALTGGQKVTIDTDPAATVILAPDGTTSWIGALNWPTAVLWALRPGDNTVTFTVTGSGSGTSITLAYNPRYETA